MKNKKIIIGIIFIILITFLILYPNIEFYKDNHLYMMSYSKSFEVSKDFQELDEVTCYDESYTYNSKRDITVSSFEYKSFLFFKWLKVEYTKGNLCEKEYLLEESYINNFLENAIINEESDEVNLQDLIKNKKAIVKNKRYPWNDKHKYLSYKLDNKYQEMYIYYNEEGLLIIQVGLSDEGPKYIAYQ